jgi:hypothetical protein
MKRVFRFIWESFAEQLWLRVVLLGLVVAIFGGSGYVAYQAYDTPIETTERVTLVSYLQRGQFNPVLNLVPDTTYSSSAKEDGVSPGIFMKLVDSIDLSYSYEFSPKRSVDKVTVEMLAVVESPGVWRKELVLVPKTTEQRSFIVEFPLDLKQFEELIKIVEEEIGVRSSPHSLTILARVHTVATVGSETLDEEFVQTLAVKQWEGNTLEWGEELGLTKVGTVGTVFYRHHGRFDYAVGLLPNSLFGPVTMTSAELPRPPVPVPPGAIQPIRDLEWVDVTFSYDFQSDEPVSNFAGDVYIAALLQDAETKWTASVASISDTLTGKEHSVTLPLDLETVTALIEAGKEEESPTLAPKLTLEADVSVSFDTDSGPTSEHFTQVLDVNLVGGSIEWGDKFVQTRSGAQTEAVSTTHPEVITKRRYSTAIAGVFALVLLIVAGVYTTRLVGWVNMNRAMPLRKIVKTEKKHKDVLVDIAELPTLAEGDTIIQVSSLEALGRVSDTFMKPILRRLPDGAREPYAYYVLDGSTRYEYVFSEKSTSTAARE